MVLEGITAAVRRFLRGADPYERAVDSFVRELQRELLKADVNVRVVFNFTRAVRERASKEKPPPGASRREWFVKIVYEELVKMFGGEREPNVLPSKTPYVMMLVGIQGSGKTTTAGKLALYYKRKGYVVGLVCADTYRPAAYEQLRTLAEQVGALFYGDPKERDAVELAARGVKELIERRAQVIIVDTAGRHGYGDEERLLDEMRIMAERLQPDEIVFVIDAAMGQKAYDLAKRFSEATPIASMVVTKLDGTARGGGALSAVAATGASVKFVGVGEKLEELEVFKPKSFVSRLLGMGDLESLLEKMRALEEAAELEKRAAEMLSGRLNMRIVYQQLQSMRKLGPLSKVLRMIPGLALALPDERIAKVSEEKMKRWLAIIESMTYEELDKPEIIDKRRMRRLALGSGTSLEDVRELLNYYETLKRLLKQVRRKKGLLRKFGLPEEPLT